MENNSKFKNYNENRSEVLKFIPKGISRMLDVGCSSGNFSALVKSQMTVEIWGIEIDADFAENAKKYLDKVIVGDIKQNINLLPSSYFDCIVFNDILEHLYDPSDILIGMKKCLSKEGVIVASIPNFREIVNLYNLLIKADLEYKDWGILDRTHLRFFTKKSIIRMFEECGFTIQRIEGINPNMGWKMQLLNILTFGLIKDTQFVQFLIIAKAA